MKKPGRLLIVGLVVGVTVGYVITFGNKSSMRDIPRLDGPPTVGKEISNFSLVDLDGKKISLVDFSGKPIIINFWATWCPPCKNEIPLLQEFSKVYQESAAMIGINVMESNTVVKEFVKMNEITFPILLDSDGRIQETYRIIGLPTTYFVDENKILRAQHIGALDEILINGYGNMIGLSQ